MPYRENVRASSAKADWQDTQCNTLTGSGNIYRSRCDVEEDTEAEERLRRGGGQMRNEGKTTSTSRADKLLLSGWFIRRFVPQGGCGLSTCHVRRALGASAADSV
eukprot:7553918-Pyramimonas_sp.AAC.1